MKSVTILSSGAACILLCLPALDAIASSEEPARVEPLTPVTHEMLTTLRAPTSIEKPDYQLVETENGPMPLSDGRATHLSAIRALQEAFHIPVCLEYAYRDQSLQGQDTIPRFSFAIEANERLVDVLDKLEKNSGGFVQWTLFHDRIVLAAEAVESKDEANIMNRPVHVAIEADTLLSALEQVEAAYNKQYPDVPLIVRPLYVRLILQGSAALPERTGKFVLRADGALREIVLALLDQMQDPAICYSFAATYDLKGRWYCALRVTKDDAPDLDTYADADESTQHDYLLERASQRLDEYLEQAAKVAAGRTKP